jgi:branched-chain amino acid transport system substrate-binding protein
MAKIKLVVSGLIILTVVVLSGLVACAPTPAPGEKTVKMGMIVPTSGIGAGYGLPMARAARIEVDLINAKGGFNVGGDTYKIELIVADTKFTSEGSVAAVNELVYGENVKFTVGPIVGFEIMATAPITTKEKVLSIVGGYVKPIGPEYPYQFRGIAAPEVTIPELLTWTLDRYPYVKKVAIYDGRGESGFWCKPWNEATCKALGLEVVDSPWYEPGTTDFYPLLSKTLAAKPDLIALSNVLPSEVAMIVKQAREQGYEGLFYDISPAPEVELNSIAGAEASNGVIAWAHPSMAPFGAPGEIELRTLYEEKYGEWAPIALDLSFDFEIITKAMEEVGSTNDVDKICAVLKSGKSLDTSVGAIYFGGKEIYGVNGQLYRHIYIGEMKDGKFDYITQLTAKECEEVSLQFKDVFTTVKPAE